MDRADNELAWSPRRVIKDMLLQGAGLSWQRGEDKSGFYSEKRVLSGKRV